MSTSFQQRSPEDFSFVRHIQSDADEPLDQVEHQEDPAAPEDPTARQCQPNDATPTLVDPLEELLLEAEVAAADKDVDPLDALLDSAMAAQAEKAGIKAKRKQLATAGGELSPVQREALRAQIATWEAKEEWTPAAVVVKVSETKCKHCAATTRSVDALYERQVSRKPDGGQRWIVQNLQFPGRELMKLQREVLLTRREVAICHACVGGQGFVNEAECDW